MRKLHTAAGDRWREGLLRPDGELSPRVRSLDIEQDFWKNRSLPGCRDSYADRVWEALVDLMQGRNICGAIEIGPGWGNYTLPLSHVLDRLTLVDLSPENLASLKARIPEDRCTVTAVCSPWETAEVEKQDLVFGYNCLYRLTEPEAFLMHMEKSAGKLCVIGMNQPPEHPWLPALEAAGISIHYTRQGCQELKAVARELKLPVHLVTVPNFRSYCYGSREDLLKRVRSFLMEDCPEERLLEIVLPFHKQQPDGSLRCDYPFRSQLLWWEP